MNSAPPPKSDSIDAASLPGFGFSVGSQPPQTYPTTQTPIEAMLNAPIPRHQWPFMPTAGAAGFPKPAEFANIMPTLSSGARPQGIGLRGLNLLQSCNTGGSGSQGNSITTSTIYVEGNSPLMGTLQVGEIVWMHKDTYARKRIGREDMIFHTLLNLAALNRILASDTPVTGVSSAMDTGDGHHTDLDPSQDYAIVGIVESILRNKRHGFFVVSVATSGSEEMFNIWGKNDIWQGDRLNFIGRYVPRHEVIGGKYFIDPSSGHGVRHDSAHRLGENVAKRIFQIQPERKRHNGYTADDILSRDSDGRVHKNRLIRFAISKQSRSKGTNRARRVWFDAAETNRNGHVNCFFTIAPSGGGW